MTLDPKRRFYLNGYGQKPNEYTWHSQMINRLNTINTSIQNSGGGGITSSSKDAFDRLRVSEPYTLFDSQNRYQKDPQFNEVVGQGGSIDYNANESTVTLNSGSGPGGLSIRQTYRRFPYQPGKSLLALMTFSFSEPTGGVGDNKYSRVGYFDDNNGIYFERQIIGSLSPEGVNLGKTLRFTIRSSGVNTSVDQENWNVDKFDGTGPSGRTIDVTKAQILFINLEWLGVGIVKVGFFVDGVPCVAHEFKHDNQVTTTYMTTAILPIRYEVIGGQFTSEVMTQICSSVISEGGYSAKSYDYVAKQDVIVSNIDSIAYLPIVSIQLAAGRDGAVILPNKYEFLPLTSQNYEVVLLKNPELVNSTFANTITNNSNVVYDTAATAISNIGEVVDIAYITATGSGGIQGGVNSLDYKWDMQLGYSMGSIAGPAVSDIYTVAVRTVSGATQGSGVGFITFYDLTI